MSLFLLPELLPLCDLHVTSHAAGAHGYGALYLRQWFAYHWLPRQVPLSIAYKELFPVVVAAHLLGENWSLKHISFQFHASVVFALNSRTSKDLHIMLLLRSLLMVTAHFNFTFEAKHPRTR